MAAPETQALVKLFKIQFILAIILVSICQMMCEFDDDFCEITIAFYCQTRLQ